MRYQAALMTECVVMSGAYPRLRLDRVFISDRCLSPQPEPLSVEELNLIITVVITHQGLFNGIEPWAASLKEVLVVSSVSWSIRCHFVRTQLTHPGGASTRTTCPFRLPLSATLRDDLGIVTSGVRGERYSLTDALNRT